jgi:hypothetical protein
MRACSNRKPSASSTTNQLRIARVTEWYLRRKSRTFGIRIAVVVQWVREEKV